AGDSAMQAGKSRRGLAWQAALLGGAFLFMVGLSFEIDRALARVTVGAAAWHPVHARMLWITLLWGAGAFCLWLTARRIASAFCSIAEDGTIAAPPSRDGESLRDVGWGVLAISAIAWLTLDSVAWRFMSGVTLAPTIFNAQFAVGTALGVMVGSVAWL